MLYTVLFFARFFPFWAVPLALVIFELGMYHFNRRVRSLFLACFSASFFLVVASILWVVFEGYWRAGPIIKNFWDG